MRPEIEIPVKILMVSKNPLDQHIISNSLEIGEVILHIAESAVETTRLIEKSFYSLIIIDPFMQHQSGFELLKLLKDGERTTHIPVVFFSSEEFDGRFWISQNSPKPIDIIPNCDEINFLEGHLRTLIDAAKYRRKILLEKNKLRTELNKYKTLIDTLSIEYAFKFNDPEKKPITVVHENTSVLVTGFVNFRTIAKQENQNDLINTLEIYFQKFNEIMERYEMDKIYTIGDAVVNAGSLHQGNAQSAVKLITVALEMRHFCKKLEESDFSSKKNPWHFCCGISTGSLTSDSLYHAPFDIWGDTVSEAIELKKIAGENKIIISQFTKTLVEDSFEIESLGLQQVHNRDQELFEITKSKKPYPTEWAERISNQLYLT